MTIPYFINLRSSTVGGDPVADISDINLLPNFSTIKNLISHLRGKDILLATHGFNVDQNYGIATLSRWENLMTLGTNMTCIGVLWPGDSTWLHGLDYPVEGNVAIRSGQLLAQFINQYFIDAKSLSFVSHSLGARVILETIANLNLPGKDTICVDSIVLMAGAIDDDCLTDEYKNSVAKVNQISILASHKDDVLEFAFPIGNFLGGIVTRDHPYWHAALGREGPATIVGVNMHSGGWEIPDNWDYGHGDYLPTSNQNPPSMLPPVDLPFPSPIPPQTPTSKSAWSAGFVSTRLC